MTEQELQELLDMDYFVLSQMDSSTFIDALYKQSARIKEMEEALKDLCDAAELEDDDERGLTTWDAYKNARKTLKRGADV